MYYCLRLGGFTTDLFFYYMMMLKFVVLDKIDFKLPQFKNIHNFESFELIKQFFKLYNITP